MQDTELMKKCMEDAARLMADHHGIQLCKMTSETIVSSANQLACELFRHRSTQFTTEIVMEGEDVTQEIPY